MANELIKQISIAVAKEDGSTETVVRPIGVEAANVNGTVAAAEKLTTNAGSTTQPIYFKDGVPTVTKYTLAQSVTTTSKLTDTTYTAGTGLSLSGTTFNHSNSVTAGTVGSKSGDIKVPWITYDAQGHITNTGTTTISEATESKAGLMSAADKKAVNKLASGDYDLGTASKDDFGIVKIGDNINVSGGLISIAKATGSADGFVYLTKANYTKLNSLLGLITIS